MKTCVIEKAAITNQSQQVAVIRTVFPTLRIEDSNIFALPPTFLFRYDAINHIGHWIPTIGAYSHVVDAFFRGEFYEAFRPFLHKYGNATAQSLLWLAPNLFLMQKLKLCGWKTDDNDGRVTFHGFVNGPNDILQADS